MVLDKRKYTKQEVEGLLENNCKPFVAEIEELKNRLGDALRENEKLKKENSKYKNTQAEVTDALTAAKKRADEYAVKLAEAYENEVQKLKLFYLKWQSYFNYLIETYPNYRLTEKVKKIREKLVGLFGRTKSDKAEIESIYSEIDGVAVLPKGGFDPKSKIQEYIQSESGFDMNEVLYPDESELNLEELCKELGIS